MPASYYDTLRVPQGASPADVRQAYRRMAGRWHPEHWRKREQALGDAMFRSLAEAFSMLSDPAMRALYDRSLAGEPVTRSPAAVDSEAALRIFGREIEGFAAELAAQGLAPEDVARYLVSLEIPEQAARAFCGLASAASGDEVRGAWSGRRAAVVLLGLACVVVFAVVAILWRLGPTDPAAPPAVMQSTPGAAAGVSDTPPQAAQAPAESPTPAQLSAREFNRLMAEFEQRHPEFDPKSPKYDAGATDSLRRRIEALEAQGHDSPEALRQAMSEYERLLAAQAAARAQPAPPARSTAPANAPAPRSSAGGAGSASGASSNPAPAEGDPLRTLCETFPHACRR